mgnify:FL=1
MKNIGLFYGSDTGTTEMISEQIINLIGKKNVTKHDIFDTKVSDFENYNCIILGLSTWYDGELQSDWDSFFEEFQTIDFKNKKVAIFGIGDQYSYADTFIDGVGIIGKVVKTNNGILIGEWSTDGYFHDSSVAELEMGTFCGLAIDEDNQSDMTAERLKKWTKQILTEFTQ